MSQCAGCTGGLGEVSHSDTNCIHLTGLGTTSSHLVATLQIDPASPAAITCGVAGLSVAGGGGGGGQVLYFTVGTPGPNAFGGIGATPPTLLASADYVGDGINDSVAIQAALNASAAIAATTSMTAIVLILPGVYSVNSPLVPKGVPIYGLGNQTSTAFYTATFTGAAANTRTIDATVSGSQFVDIQNIQMVSLNGGAAVIKAQSLQMINCGITGDGKGADAGLIDVGYITNPVSSALGRFEYNFVSGTTSPFPDPGLILRDPIANDYNIRFNSFGTDLVITGNNHTNANISNNVFQTCNLRLNAQSLTHFKICENRISNGSIIATLAGGSSFFWIVNDNTIENGQINIDSLIVSKFRGNTVQATLFGDAIVISNGGEHIIEGNQVDFAKNNCLVLTTANNCEVIGNRFRFAGTGTFNVDDGIKITTSNACTIQANSIESTQAKYGIHIVSGNTNMVTNNRLNGSGVTASFFDGGVGTIVTAGNYL